MLAGMLAGLGWRDLLADWTDKVSSVSRAPKGVCAVPYQHRQIVLKLRYTTDGIQVTSPSTYLSTHIQ